MEKLSLDHLPPGVRFSPKDPEVIELYLKKKITGNDEDTWFIREIEFYEDEPWDLPIKSGIATEDQEWFFFTSQSLKHQKDNQKKRKRGQKQELVNRQTKAGLWKSTGPDREIESGESLIGMKKTLVFHKGSNKKEEKAIRTNWVMHEYRTTQKEFDGKHPGQKAFVLCRLFNNEEKSNKGGPAKSKPGLSDVTELVQCNNDNDYDKAYVAENQAAKVDHDLDLDKALEMFVIPPVSPELGCEADNYRTSFQCLLEEKYDGITTKTIVPIEYNGYNTYVAKNQVAEVTSDKDKGSCSGSDANALVDLSEEEIELVMGLLRVPPEDSPSSLPLTTTDVSTPITVKSSHKETQSEPTLAPASQELPEQAEYHPINGITRFDNAAPLACKNDYNADAAENQVAEVNTTEFGGDLDIDKALEMFCSTPPGPRDCNLYSPSTLNSAPPAVSYPTTAEASLEEAQSLLAPASVSPKLVSEADNCSMSF